MSEWKGTESNVVGRTMFECVDRDQESLPGSSCGRVILVEDSDILLHVYKHDLLLHHN